MIHFVSGSIKRYNFRLGRHNVPVTVSASVSGDVRMSMDHSGPIRGQYPGHVTTPRPHSGVDAALHWAIIAGVGPQFRVWAGQFCTSIKVYSTVSRLLNTSKENLVNKTGGVRNRVWV